MLDLLRAAAPDADITEKNVKDFALHEVQPGAIVEPRTAEQAAAVIRLANERDWRVELAGGRTQPLGNRRTRADVVISTRRLDAVAEYEPADLVIGVQAGMTLHALQREVGKHGQFLALDAPATRRSTLGGLIAGGRAGPLRMGYGGARDHVLGLQIVTGDGRVLNIGGRVVKNVAGYDLVRLMTGSAGTLGMITQAFVRLRPLPQTDRTLIARAAAAAPLIELAAFITQQNLEAVALELSDGWSLYVRLHGNAEAVEDASARISVESARLGSAVAPGTERDWEAFEQQELEAATVVRIADLPTRLPTTLQVAHKLIARMGGRARIAAHAGNGIVRVLIGSSDIDKTAFAIGEARTVMGVSGGSVIVHSSVGELMRRVDAYGGDGNTLPLMVRLKHLFDPGGILAPGRFVV